MKISRALTALGLLATCSSAASFKGGAREEERNLSAGGTFIPNLVQEFKYPSKMPPPPEMWVEGFASRLHAQNIQKYETPIQVWQTWRLDQIMWNCIASYHPSALNALTKEAPVIRAPPEYHTSEARALCMIHAVNKLVPELIPISADLISNWLVELGLDSSIMPDSVATTLALEEGIFTPRVIGSLLAGEIIFDMQRDGWNYKGLDAPDGKKCTANCRPFSDTTGYIPKNDPWSLRAGKDKYAWQPLIESDELGFYYAQEHVTPHIGFTANPVILDRAAIDSRELDDPKYDYDEEVDKVIANVADLDDFKKEIVRFMDNKINIAGGMIMRLRAKYNLSLEAQVFYHYGYTSTELDVVILAWKEKINHNLIRPTSLVQVKGDLQVKSFASEGTHDAKDWVPYIRVMPHAEYPSGSGCICLGIAEFIDEFLLNEYGDNSIETTWAFDTIDPVTFHDMTELYTTCGESRLWGGMHFTKSVPDSYELCEGVGKMAYTDLMVPLLGGGSYAELMDEDKEKYYG